MGQTGRVPPKHISVSLEWKHLYRGVLLYGGKRQCCGTSCRLALLASQRCVTHLHQHEGFQAVDTRSRAHRNIMFTYASFTHCPGISLAVL